MEERMGRMDGNWRVSEDRPGYTILLGFSLGVSLARAGSSGQGVRASCWETKRCRTYAM